jgi:HSP20 family protein
MERFWDPWSRWPSYSIVREGLWHPTMDVYDRPDDLVVELELPGTSEEDVEISVEDGHLVVEGSRSAGPDRNEDERSFSERAFGAFHRIVHLPTDVDESAAKGAFENGILTVTLPKKKRAQAKKVKIAAGK